MSTLVARDRSTIRAQLVARLEARARGRGETLDTREGSWEWLKASALAALLEALEQQAAGGVAQILPDRAAGLHLDAQGELVALPRAAGETVEAHRQRVLAWWGSILGSGSPADWVAVCEASGLCEEAYAYPYFNANLGRVDLVCLGPAQGQSVTNTRVLDGTTRTGIEHYLHGVDALGAQGEERRVVCAPVGNANVVALPELAQDVEVTIRNDATRPFPWSGSHALTVAGSTSWKVAGDHTDLVNLPWLLNVGTAFVRGGYQRVIPTGASYDGGTNRTTFTVTDAMPATPSGTGYPCPPNWESIQAAVFEYFDTLSPGDTSPATRHPAPTAARPTSIYRAPLLRAVLGVRGVSRVSLTTPAATVTPVARQLLTLGTLLVTEIP